MTQLQHLGRLDNLEEALAERQRTIAARSRSLLRAAASLSVVVDDASCSPETVPR
jgi:hypothetical protein